jgi:hypothetical protein
MAVVAVEAAVAVGDSIVTVDESVGGMNRAGVAGGCEQATTEKERQKAKRLFNRTIVGAL